jgi:2-methylcitrate dehydratase PrpD
VRDAIFDLAEFVHGLTYDQLPDAVVERVKLGVVDTLATLVAGSNAPGIAPFHRMLVSEGSGPAKAPIFGSSLQVAHAISLAVAMARARDYDDYDPYSGDHPTVSTVPTALTLAGLHTVSGKDLITAIAAGIEIVLRVRSATTMGPWTVGTFAPLATAAVSARLLGHSLEETRQSLALATSFFSNTRQGIRDGALVLRVHHGTASGTGYTCARLAGAGITGAKDALEGGFGHYASYHAGEIKRDVIVGGLGSTWRLPGVAIKMYPACGCTHRPIQAALSLRPQLQERLDDIESIEAQVGTIVAMSTVGEPQDRKRNPQTVVDGQFSLPYTVAVALAQGSCDLTDFTAAAVVRPKIRDISRKVTTVLNKELCSDPAASNSPQRLIVRMRSGEVLQAYVEHPLGTPANPVGYPQLEAKLRDCSAFASDPVAEPVIAEILNLAPRLESCDRVPGFFGL